MKLPHVLLALTFSLLACTAATFAGEAAPAAPKIAGATPLEWSQKLADSEMKRIGSGFESGGSNPRARWDYTPGVLALSLVRLGEVTGNTAYTEWGTRVVGTHVNPDRSEERR